jgi:hypothetical protein
MSRPLGYPLALRRTESRRWLGVTRSALLAATDMPSGVLS